jgi:hypothetical protein
MNLFGPSSWVSHYNFRFSYDNSHWYDYATWYSAGLVSKTNTRTHTYIFLPGPQSYEIARSDWLVTGPVFLISADRSYRLFLAHKKGKTNKL